MKSFIYLMYAHDEEGCPEKVICESHLIFEIVHGKYRCIEHSSDEDSVCTDEDVSSDEDVDSSDDEDE